MRTEDYDYELPEERIAQDPTPVRDRSRLFVLHRNTRERDHAEFREADRLLKRGDLLVLNDSRVLPARLRAVKRATGGEVELLLLEETNRNEWWVLLRPGKRVRPGTELTLLAPDRSVTSWGIKIEEKNLEGHCRAFFTGPGDIRTALTQLGELPLPPYITRSYTGATPVDTERYQTVYARQGGSVAAPTAGLHFTPELLDRLEAAGVEIARLTLHVGLGTFAPIKESDPSLHRMHEEAYTVPADTAQRIQEARAQGRRIVAVGTTVIRVLETVALRHGGGVVPESGKTALFIHPPWSRFVADAMFTNFHLPRSTLLMLVAAFASPGKTDGREWILEAYREAMEKKYRFYSYGDAMLIT